MSELNIDNHVTITAVTGRRLDITYNDQRNLNIVASGSRLNVLYVSGPPGPPGPIGPRGSGSFDLNGLTGSVTLYGTGGIFVITAVPNQIIISGSGYATDTDILNLSGYISNQLSQTGSILYGIITGVAGNTTALSGYVTGQFSSLSGYINQQDANLSTRIETTGSNLYNLITGVSGNGANTSALSGYVNVQISGLTSQISGLSGQIYQTGSNLYNLITGITGSNTSVIALSGYVNSQDYATGRAAILYASGLSGVLNAQINLTGTNLYNQLYNTGQLLWNRDTSISGVLAESIYQTGQIAHIETSGLSGFLIGLINATSAGVTALNGASGVLNIYGTGSVYVITQGQNIYISGNIDPNIYATIPYVTGVSGVLQNQIVSLSGFTTGISGYLQNQATGLFYPLSTNPSGYVTGDYYTKDQINNFFLYENPFYFSATPANDASGFYLMAHDYPSGLVPVTGTFTDVQNNQYLTGFITPSGQPGINGFVAGLSVGSIHAWKSNINQKDTSLYYHLFKVTTGNSYELLSVSSADTQLNASQTHLYFNAFITGAQFNPSDRLAIQWFASVNGGGTDPTIYLMWADDTMAAVTLPYSAALLNNTFYPNTNPSGFITTGQTGQFYPASNPQQYATSGNLAETGSNLYNLTTGLSGQIIADFATKSQLTQTGVILLNAIYSGDFILSGNIASTGSILNSRINNLSGYVNTQDYLTGRAAILYASGISGNFQNISTGLSGFLISYANGIGQNISGNLTQTGVNLINYVNSVGTNLSGNLAATGTYFINLNNALSGFVTGTSGNLDRLIGLTGAANIAYSNSIGNNISGNLTQTGIILVNTINTLSGNLTGQIYQTGLNLYNQIYNTGQVLWTRDSLLSGALQFQITNSGISLIQYANSIGQIISGNLTLTGQTLFTLITGLSGDGANIYATRIQLTQTGIFLINQNAALSGFITGISGFLDSKINSLSGFAISYSNSIGNNLSGNLTQTGISLINADLSLSGALTGRIFQTGIDLYNQLYNTGQILWGRDTDISGFLQNQINLTGNAAITHANNIGTVISGNLTQTGIVLINRDNNISGVLQTQINNIAAGTGFIVQNVVYTTGNQFIQGTKYFAGNTYIDNLFVTGTQTVINTQDVYVGDNWLILNATGGARDSAIFISTGFTGMNATGAVIGFDVPSNTWRFGIGGYLTDLVTLPQIASIADILVASGGLENRIALTGLNAINYANSIGLNLSGNLSQTGATLISLINNTSGALTGRIFQTGVDLYNQIYNTGQLLFNRDTGISGALLSQIAQTGQAAINYTNSVGAIISGNLTQTGVNLLNILVQTSGALTGRIFQTGLDLYNQLYNTGQILWNRDIAISGALEVRIAITGQNSINYTNSVGTILSGNLTQTGVQLGAQINALSGLVTGFNNGVISFLTGLLPTGFDTYYINFPITFPTIPRVALTMELNNPANGMYGVSVSGRSTTGFWALLTDTVDTSGVFLDVLAKT